MSQVAVAGLLTVLVSFLDVKNSEAIFLFLHILRFHFLTLRKHFLYCICVHFLPGVHCASSSNSGKISLHSVRPGGSHAATHARDLWRGTATPACICSSRTGEILISPSLMKLLNGGGGEFFSVFFVVVKHLPDLVSGCGCCGPSGETEGHHRFPDPHNTGIAGSWREGWAGHRGVSSRNTHPRGLCNPSQESQLWNLETTPQNKSLFPLASCSVFFYGYPFIIVIFWVFLNGWKEQSRPSPFVICYPSPALIKNGCFGPGSLEWADTWRVKPGPRLLNFNGFLLLQFHSICPTGIKPDVVV